MIPDKDRTVTETQKIAIKICERWLRIKFQGDIENYRHVRRFLDKNYRKAKRVRARKLAYFGSLRDKKDK